MGQAAGIRQLIIPSSYEMCVEIEYTDAQQFVPDYEPQEDVFVDPQDLAQYRHLMQLIKHHREKAYHHTSTAELLSTIYLQLRNWE